MTTPKPRPLGPHPPQPGDSWWDQLYDPTTGDTNTPPPAKRKPRKPKPKKPRPTPLADALRDTHLNRHQQHKTRHLVYWGTAAATGWWTGLSPMLLDAMTTRGAADGVAAGVWTGIGFTIFGSLLAWSLRVWICRIPLAAAVLALALYGPNTAL
ncbi:MAG TPA: hypothetical protein DEQ61_13155 [Streptomyces sp.]|nr:hypothetical protein [Streptomyces sp.]